MCEGKNENTKGKEKTERRVGKRNVGMKEVKTQMEEGKEWSVNVCLSECEGKRGKQP